MAGPVSDRLALYTAVDADLEPIFLLYDGGGAATEAVAGVGSQEPLVDVRAARRPARTGCGRSPIRPQLAAIAADLLPRRAVIADGHHRYATYLQRQAEAHAGRPRPRPVGLRADLPRRQLRVRAGGARHPPGAARPGRRRPGGAGGGRRSRCTTWTARTSRARSAALGQRRAGTPSCSSAATAARCACSPPPTRRGSRRRCRPSARQAWRDLDVSVLHHVLVEDVWGLTDDVATVGYEHDVPAAIAAARASRGHGACC